MALAVLLDAIGKRPQTPIFTFMDFATGVGDDAGKFIGHGFDLLGRNILTRNEHAFIQAHA